MPAYGAAPNAYSTGHLMTTCGADVNAPQAEVLAFGFVARSLRIVNSCGDPLYFSLDPNLAASTGSASIAGAGSFQAENSLALETLSLKTTSTATTGGSVARPKVSVLAWSA